MGQDALIGEIQSFGSLGAGRDGGTAAAPDPRAIAGAAELARAVGPETPGISASLHVDGSVIIDVADGEAGTFRVKGDGTVVYVVPRIGRGTFPLTCPEGADWIRGLAHIAAEGTAPRGIGDTRNPIQSSCPGHD